MRRVLTGGWTVGVELRGCTTGKLLSARETEVLRLTSLGASCAAAGRILGVAPATAWAYKQRAHEKLGLVSKALPPKRPEWPGGFDYHEQLHRWQRKFLRAVRKAARYDMARAARMTGLNRTHFYKLCRDVEGGRLRPGHKRKRRGK